ncbi:MAG: hypothetical protein E4G99_02705 [Anaerolineales bacterium]|nr:MAG: hypothetical protein E4G99_02705 [Anaerolineales bacterium]
MAIGIGLRQVQQALDNKANEIQHKFIELSDELDELTRQMLEVDDEERKVLKEKQIQLRERQLQIAEDVNVWRTRARHALQHPGVSSLRAFLHEMLELNEDLVTPAVQQALMLLDLPADERLQHEPEKVVKQQSPAGRLLERARSDFELRSSDRGVRQREAVAFANRPGMSQDQAIIDEVAAAIDDQDPLVRELANLTTLQLYRFRANRMADLDAAHQATRFLAKMNHPAVIPVLIEILKNPRVGYVQEGDESVQKDNGRSRMIVLLRLVEWHTAEAQTALRTMKFDRDPHIVKAAERALELFPGPWSGPVMRENASPES